MNRERRCTEFVKEGARSRARRALAVAMLPAAIGAAPAHGPPGALVALLARDDAVAGCARDAGESARTYAAHAFAYRALTLSSGEQMVVAEATDGCLALGQSTRFAVFERTKGGYRPVLASMTMPGFAREGRDGTVTLPNHELIQTIFESTYVWNGKRYAFSDARSHRYDVMLGIRRPSIVRVRFAHGASSAVLSGTAAVNFGQDYIFDAKAGQRVALDLVRPPEHPPIVDLIFGERRIGGISHGSYRGVLPATGTYTLSVEGADIQDDTLLSPYTLRLKIQGTRERR